MLFSFCSRTLSYLVIEYLLMSICFTAISVQQIGRVFQSNLWYKISSKIKDIKDNNQVFVEMKTSYPGCMSAGFGDSVSWSVCGPFDTLLLFGITDAFFPFLVSTWTSFLVLQSTQTNMIDGQMLRLQSWWKWKCKLVKLCSDLKPIWQHRLTLTLAAGDWSHLGVCKVIPPVQHVSSSPAPSHGATWLDGGDAAPRL